MGNIVYSFLQQLGSEHLFATYGEARAAVEELFAARRDKMGEARNDLTVVARIQVKDPNNVTALEKTQIAMEVVLGRERQCDIAKRLGISYDSVRQWVTRQRQNPGRVFYDSVGRPSRAEREDATRDEHLRMILEASNDEAYFIDNLTNLEVKRAFQVCIILLFCSLVDDVILDLLVVTIYCLCI
jgi:transposase-like protein